MKKNVFVLTLFSLFTIVTFAQNLSLPLSCVKSGWGWNTDFTYDVANPNQYAGEGCEATTVTKVDINGWVGSFGLADLPTGIDWTKYDKILLKVYANANGVAFDDTVSYKGWYDNDPEDANPGVDNIVNCTTVQTDGIPASNWVTREISLTASLVNASNNTITYSSLSDVTFGLNTIQFNYVALPQATASIYIGEITLKDKNISSIAEVSEAEVSVSVNTNKITVKSEEQVNSISIINAIGVEVAHNLNLNSISISTLPNGLYIIKVTSGKNSTFTQTFIKK